VLHCRTAPAHCVGRHEEDIGRGRKRCSRKNERICCSEQRNRPRNRSLRVRQPGSLVRFPIMRVQSPSIHAPYPGVLARSRSSFLWSPGVRARQPGLYLRYPSTRARRPWSNAPRYRHRRRGSSRTARTPTAQQWAEETACIVASNRPGYTVPRGAGYRRAKTPTSQPVRPLGSNATRESLIICFAIDGQVPDALVSQRVFLATSKEKRRDREAEPCAKVELEPRWPSTDALIEA
jgi:hypothetical protein